LNKKDMSRWTYLALFLAFVFIGETRKREKKEKEYA